MHASLDPMGNPKPECGITRWSPSNFLFGVYLLQYWPRHPTFVDSRPDWTQLDHPDISHTVSHNMWPGQLLNADVVVTLPWSSPVSRGYAPKGWAQPRLLLCRHVYNIGNIVNE